MMLLNSAARLQGNLQAEWLPLPCQLTRFIVRVVRRYWVKKSAEEEKVLMQKEFGTGQI